MNIKLLYILCFFSTICFGQTIKSEELLLHNGLIELPGTLSYLEEKTPLIIWIHGSGNVDRNGNQGTTIKANYIKQFRDRINSHNIAFFSYDKRTANSKNAGHLKETLFDDFVADAEQIIEHFKTNQRFSQIILIGHSQGSLVAMLASEKTDKFISLAGPSERFDKAIITQISQQSTEFAEVARAHFQELFETGTIQQVNPLLASIFAKPNLSFIRNWSQYTPFKEIEKIRIPTLIINGTKDLQVKTNDAETLHKALPTSELVLISNMNHVLKDIQKETDNINSYYTANFELAAELIPAVVNFINK